MSTIEIRQRLMAMPLRKKTPICGVDVIRINDGCWWIKGERCNLTDAAEKLSRLK